MKRMMNGVFIVVIIVAVGILAYGGYQYYETYQQTKEADAKANDLLDNRVVLEVNDGKPTLIDMYLEKLKFMPSVKQGEAIGKLLIPKINGDMPIVEGVHEDDLKKGVGHDAETLLPLDGGQTVLSGHRDTVFRDMGKLEIGDVIIMSLPYGDFEYVITDLYVVPADDLTVIVPHDEETLTVTTCYPFDFVGHAPDRYIIDAEPTFDMSELEEKRASLNN